jgi:gamma-glutamylcyclotransferase (GGCT)/AIG2-like uncharacterized protein YtfP
MKGPGLFVYGTLLSGQSAGGMLGGMPRRPAVMAGRLWLLPAGYPVLVDDDPEPLPLRGELVELSSQGVLMVVDLYEGGADSLYHRAEATARVEGRAIQAWVYRSSRTEVHRAGGRRLAIDDWRLVAPRPV